MKTLHRYVALTTSLAATLSGCTSDGSITQAVQAPDAALAATSTARPLPAGSTTTWTVNGCVITVTYTWNGFKGRGLIASYGVYENLGSLDASYVLQNDADQLGSSGTATHTFTLTANAHASRTILARGALVDGRKFSELPGSTSASSTSFTSTCGLPLL